MGNFDLFQMLDDYYSFLKQSFFFLNITLHSLHLTQRWSVVRKNHFILFVLTFSFLLIFFGEGFAASAQETPTLHSPISHVTSEEMEFGQSHGIFSHGVLNPNAAIHPSGNSSSIWGSIYVAFKLKFGFLDPSEVLFKPLVTAPLGAVCIAVASHTSLFLKVCCLRI